MESAVTRYNVSKHKVRLRIKFFAILEKFDFSKKFGMTLQRALVFDAAPVFCIKGLEYLNYTPVDNKSCKDELFVGIAHLDHSNLLQNKICLTLLTVLHRGAHYVPTKIEPGYL